MKFENLEERVLAAKTDPDELENLIKDYIPFIRKNTVRVVPADVYDSFSTTAMSAFAEAVAKFRNNGTKFLGFASLVITNRVKDQIRKEFKPEELAVEIPEIAANPDDITDRMIEVSMFRNELMEYGIVLDELVKVSPRHKSTRAKANLAAETLAGNEELYDVLSRTGKVPISRLCELSGIAAKLIEQKRKYIIARALIRRDKYSYLKDFIG